LTVVDECYGDFAPNDFWDRTNSTAFIDLPVSQTLRFSPMIGQTISHFRIVDKLGDGETILNDWAEIVSEA
jgi:hypothetical protein